MYNEQTFEGGVQARTVVGGIVQHPVVVTLDGVNGWLKFCNVSRRRRARLAASISRLIWFPASEKTMCAMVNEEATRHFHGRLKNS